MATITPQRHTVTLTIDSETRETLIREAITPTSELGDLNTYLIERNRTKVLSLVDTATFAVGLLDALGWGNCKPGVDTEFTFDRSPLVRWLVDVREVLQSQVGGAMLTMGRLERGEQLYDDRSPEEAIKGCRREIDQSLSDAERINDLISRILDVQTVA